MQTIVVKFGGSSLADAAQIRKAADIIKKDPARRFAVASAPGKRSKEDIKVTDMLYRCEAAAAAGRDFEPELQAVRERFQSIIDDLGVSYPLEAELDVIRKHLKTAPDKEYMASRGEYLNSGILAAYLGFAFVDPAEVIRFHENGQYDAETTHFLLSNRLNGLENAVVAGFYGAEENGRVRTFSRGGSDLTGSIVAEAVRADLYENWTDVSGMMSADPRVVDSPRVIDFISYQELRELSYMGATVLHEEAVFPVRRAGIAINIRNTNAPEDPGTMIVPSLPRGRRPRKVTGVAGRTGFSSIQIEKSLMNGEVGFAFRLLSILNAHGIPFEHCPTGIDTMSVFLRTEYLNGCREEVLREIRDELKPDMLAVEDELALLAIVGQGMAYSKGTAARVFTALAEAGVNIRMLDQGSSEMNIIVGVEESDFEDAVRAIYRAVM
ncbi:MAG: aspartate kinase [Clostridia bacterium]|nr:aspartate kinase [Clostridia bacterium]